MSGAKVLVVDAGGRGNAIAHAFARSTAVEAVIVAPGNAGSEMIEKCCLAMEGGRALKSIPELLAYAKNANIDLTFVGPEGYLSEGIVNAFQEEGQRIVGPCKEAAILEGSKCYAKDLLKSLNVPVPPCQNFSDAADAREYARQYCNDHPGKGLVVKADGLAAGKGSVVCSSLDESLVAIMHWLNQGTGLLDQGWIGSVWTELMFCLAMAKQFCHGVGSTTSSLCIR
jgi:phosphoribosylamine--glycine ligase